MKLEIRLLGPVEARLGGQPLALVGAKQRAVLAMLALDANRAVSLERLIDGLWDERPPASAAKNVQLYVSQLRRLLSRNGGEAAIATRGRGYELRVESDAVDVARFERLLDQAERAQEAGASARAARAALELWRGAPLADVAGEPFAAAETRRLEERRLLAIELAIEQDLAAGRHRELIGELDSLLAQRPFQERLHGLRMLALYRCGRQAEALEAYGDARRALTESCASFRRRSCARSPVFTRGPRRPRGRPRSWSPRWSDRRDRSPSSRATAMQTRWSRLGAWSTNARASTVA